MPGMIDEDGYVWIMARTDDVINVAGHRLSTGAMEEVLAEPSRRRRMRGDRRRRTTLKGQLPMGFVCLNKGCDRDAWRDREGMRCSWCATRIGPVAAFRLAAVVDRLPKTRSGKILRATMAKIADGEECQVPATIDDPAILDEIRAAMAPLGYPQTAAR